MSENRVLVEPFQADVLEWLSARAEIVVVDPWLEPERWQIEASQVDAVISRKGRIERVHMAQSKGRLKIIARTGVGVDPSRVDLDAAREYRVWVTNIPGVNSVSVAELVFGQMIAVARKTIAADRAVKEGRWSDYLQFIGTELANKTIGIVGFGNIGTRVALRARAFEMELLVYDPYVPEGRVTAIGGGSVNLVELLTQSDFVTVHCPLNSETKGMIGAAELALMKPSAFLINAARGGIVDESALIDVLNREAIAGAILDVVEQEPPEPDQPLFRLSNVLFTPHLGAATSEASSRGEWGAAQEVVRVLGGEPPQNPVISFD